MRDGTYTLGQIRQIAGDLERSARDANEAWARAVLNAHASNMAGSYARYVNAEIVPPISRTTRLRRRLARWRWEYGDRLRIAIDALRGRHYCDY